MKKITMVLLSSLILVSGCSKSYTEIDYEAYTISNEYANLIAYEISGGNALTAFNSLDEAVNHTLLSDNTYITQKNKTVFYNQDLFISTDEEKIHPMTPRSEIISQNIKIVFLTGEEKVVEGFDGVQNYKENTTRIKIQDGSSFIFLPVLPFPHEYHVQDYLLNRELRQLNFNPITLEKTYEQFEMSKNNDLTPSREGQHLSLITQTNILQKNGIFFEFTVRDVGESKRSIVTIAHHNLPNRNSKLHSMFSSLEDVSLPEDQIVYFTFYFEKNLTELDIISFFLEDDAPVSFDDVFIHRKFTDDFKRVPIKDIEDFNQFNNRKDN